MECIYDPFASSLRTEAVDYQPVVPKIAVFPIGSVPGDVWCTDIAIIDDNTTEPSETFTFSVAVSDFQLCLDPASALITIVDNDGTCVLYRVVNTKTPNIYAQYLSAVFLSCYFTCTTDLVFPELPTDPSLPLSVSFIGGTPLVADGTVTVATAVSRDAY